VNQLTVVYGRDPAAMARTALEQAGVARDLRPDLRVLLKPNLVTAKPSTSGATTTPELVSGVIDFLKDCGVRDITLAEGSWVGCDTARAFRACGFDALARRHGVKLVDLKKDQSLLREADGSRLKVCRTALETDYFINLPVLKGHCQTRLTCALKNLKGCIPDDEKRRYHSAGLHRPIAQLASVLRPQLTVVDALCGDLTFEEGGTPVRLDRLIVGRDPVLVDSYGAALLGYRPEEIEHVRLAAALGVGDMRLESARIREIGTPPADSPDLPRNLAHLTRHVRERAACSACYGSLLHALQRLADSKQLGRLREPVCIGQGFRDTTADGLGVGACTRGLGRSVPGCPPEAGQILPFLRASFDA